MTAVHRVAWSRRKLLSFNSKYFCNSNHANVFQIIDYESRARLVIDRPYQVQVYWHQVTWNLSYTSLAQRLRLIPSDHEVVILVTVTDMTVIWLAALVFSDSSPAKLGLHTFACFANLHIKLMIACFEFLFAYICPYFLFHTYAKEWYSWGCCIFFAHLCIFFEYFCILQLQSQAYVAGNRLFFANFRFMHLRCILHIFLKCMFVHSGILATPYNAGAWVLEMCLARRRWGPRFFYIFDKSRKNVVSRNFLKLYYCYIHCPCARLAYVGESGTLPPPQKKCSLCQHEFATGYLQEKKYRTHSNIKVRVLVVWRAQCQAQWSNDCKGFHILLKSNPYHLPYFNLS